MLLCQRPYVDVVDNLPIDNESSLSWIDEDTTAEEGKQYTMQLQIKTKLILLLSELNALIDDLAPEVRQQTWQERQEVAEESWEHIRPTIFEECVKHSALPSDGVNIILHTYMPVIMDFRMC